MDIPVIAIDGPSASGKGTVAKRVAQGLGFHYLDSGALYRAIALLSLREGVSSEDAPALARLASGLRIEFVSGLTTVSEQYVTNDLQSELCGVRASQVARHPQVRSALLGRQRAFRQAPGLVADGRDMGTVVFPNALLKVYLTARPEVRALRRYKQLIDKGNNANLRALSKDLEERDARDAARPVAPLAVASDAEKLDTSDLSIETTVGRILDWYKERAQRAVG
jgi:cytidylate kinase